jgi:heme-degrading monooxygenase HmoA
MILREWRGRASQANPDAYPTHFRSNVLPELYDIPGFLGACLSQRQLDSTIEFLVLTRWQSLEAIRRFAGNDIARSIVEPGAVTALVEYDATVQHYEVIEDAGVSGS